MENNSHRKSEEIYDVSTYTDQELYDLLDINSPTDHELEARIVFLIRKYSNMQNESGDELAEFFTNIHKRFFDVSDSEDESEPPIQFIDSKMANVIEQFTSKTIESMDNMNASQTLTNTLTNLQNSVPLANQIGNGTTNTNESNNVGYTKTLDFATGTLNPLLNQTIKRIISVDSQYRDDKTCLSSNFTFHLSEPLKDVVSMKLYSIQIPYTWYTISTGYGSNLIYLKGSSPGLNNGSYDYQISIAPGNYGPSDLASAINDSISIIKSTYTDVSFATTAMNYNSYTSINTFVIDITKQYNETSYDISFSGLTSPYNSNRIGSSSVSIPGFLGFANSSYAPYIIKSGLLPNTVSTQSNDTNLRVYTLTSSNYYFTVYKYIGPQENTSLSRGIDISFNISFSLSIGQSYTRTELVNDISIQLYNSQYVDSNYSYLKRLDISNTTLDASANGFLTNSIFQLALKTNRFNTNNIPYSKMKVVFPVEASSVIYPIWIGSNSCFGFTSLSGEVNSLISDTSPVGSSTNNYNITSKPKIQLNCIKPGFDVSGNGYTITLAPTPNMLLTDYINIINAAIASPTNTLTGNTILNEINTTYSLAQIDSSSNFNLQIDVNKNINQTNFVVDLSNFCYSFMNSTQQTIHGNQTLATNKNTFDISFQYLSSYTISTADPLLTLYSSSGSTHLRYGTANDVSYHILNPVGTYNYSQLASVLTSSLTNFQDPSGSSVLAGSSITTSVDSGYTTVTARITIIVNKTITQNDYNIQFIDYSGNSTTVVQSTDAYNSWYQYLNVDPFMIDQSYNLYNNPTTSSIHGNVSISNSINSSYISVNGYNPISQNSITLSSTNNYFDLIPREAGLTTGTLSENQSVNQNPLYYNSIRVSIPVGTYTRDQLVSALNSAFTDTSVSGSQISIVTVNGQEYTKFRITINKIFSAADYKVVFYDTVSFVKCYVGATSVKNSTWDSTLGWILGFRLATTYLLVPAQSGYKGPISIAGDTGVSTNLFNYFLICLDDYNQNHLNDGLVTVTPRDTSFPLPSYANLSNFTCDPVTGKKVYNTAATTDFKQLTQAQVYSLSQIANAKNITTSSLSNLVSTKSFGQGPFVSDVFALVPMKVAGLANGSNYVEFSGSLQNQQRTYFGPVNISKMAVKLVNDRGDVIDLNNANWSFSIIVEMLYQQKPGAKK
jgi:hypothetical protein